MSLLERINNVNRLLAVHITAAVGTMWCAYAFGLLASFALPEAIGGGVQTFIAWTSSQFLQLVLLSILMVGANVLNERSEQRAKADHNTLLEELSLLRDIHAGLAAAGLLNGVSGEAKD